MDKTQLVKEIKTAREDFVKAVEGLSDSDKRRPGVHRIYSIKDILALIASWESELITALNQIENNQKPHLIDIEDTFEWEEEQYHNNASRTFELIESDFTGVHKILLKTLGDITDSTLFDRWKFTWMEGEPLAYLIQEVAPMYELEQAEFIQEWRENNNL